MSQFLFTHSRLPARTLRLRLAATGTAGALVLGLVTALLGAQVLGVVSSDVRVTVHLTSTGETLGINSDVKYEGLRVGRVVSVDPGVGGAEDSGPTAEVLVEGQHAELIPASVRARVLPSTLFGNDYIDLVRSGGARSAGGQSAGVAGHPLTDGAEVRADESRRTVRLMDTLAATQRLLAATDPARLDTAIAQLAGALEGRGDDLATFFRDADRFLARWARHEPQVMQDLELLTTNADTMAEIEPALVRTLRNSLPMARTLVNREQETATLLRGATALLDGADGVTAFLRTHGDQVARMLDATAATLAVFAERHPSFETLLGKVPRVLRNGAAAVRNGKIQMEGVLAPQPLDPYGPEDCPRYRGLPGPNCPGGGR